MSDVMTVKRGNLLRGSALALVLLPLAGCDDMQMPSFLQKSPETAEVRAEGGSRAAKTVERDIESPEVFQATEAALWDGRPSLGGVWIAHPDVTDPERVIIRNETNGKFVIGALFRRERETPGPRLQLSSDAAAALDILAGAPTNVSVVALRREEVKAEPAPEAMTGTPVPGAPEVEEGTLDPVTAGAAAAIEAAPVAPAAEPAPAPAPKPAPKPASALSKPYIQIGIFSVEQNAKNTATSMRQAGMVPTVKEQSSSGKTFWRVLVGPAQNASELDELLKKIKAKGFTDAYAVTN